MAMASRVGSAAGRAAPDGGRDSARARLLRQLISPKGRAGTKMLFAVRCVFNKTPSNDTMKFCIDERTVLNDVIAAWARSAMKVDDLPDGIRVLGKQGVLDLGHPLMVVKRFLPVLAGRPTCTVVWPEVAEPISEPEQRRREKEAKAKERRASVDVKTQQKNQKDQEKKLKQAAKDKASRRAEKRSQKQKRKKAKERIQKQEKAQEQKHAKDLARAEAKGARDMAQAADRAAKRSAREAAKSIEKETAPDTTEAATKIGSKASSSSGAASDSDSDSSDVSGADALMHFVQDSSDSGSS